MPIPTLQRPYVDAALDSLTSELEQLRAAGHDSTKYDLNRNDVLYPPKVVVAKAIELQYGKPFSTRNFSGGVGPGQANRVLQDLGYVIQPKARSRGALPLALHKRFGRKEAFAVFGIKYKSQQQHLNLGLSPKLPNGGYFIFVTLNKDELDPAHDYDDQIFSDQLIWVTRRDVTEDHPDYVNLRDSTVPVSLFARTNSREKFVYAGELKYREHQTIGANRPQLRFVWSLRQPLSDALLQELTFGLPGRAARPVRSKGKHKSAHTRMPSTFDELKKAYSYALGTLAERTVIPEHQHFQVRLNSYLKSKGVTTEFERDFVDVAFTLTESYIGEIKVTRNLSLPQAFRTALGQILEYAYTRFPHPPRMIVFLDQRLDAGRLRIADVLAISVIANVDGDFELLNPHVAPIELKKLFNSAKSVASV